MKKFLGSLLKWKSKPKSTARNVLPAHEVALRRIDAQRRAESAAARADGPRAFDTSEANSVVGTRQVGKKPARKKKGLKKTDAKPRNAKGKMSKRAKVVLSDAMIAGKSDALIAQPKVAGNTGKARRKKIKQHTMLPNI